jgi:hypothetical protein
MLRIYEFDLAVGRSIFSFNFEKTRNGAARINRDLLSTEYREFQATARTKYVGVASTILQQYIAGHCTNTRY